jgi:hypothetical protein
MEGVLVIPAKAGIQVGAARGPRLTSRRVTMKEGKQERLISDPAKS